MFGARVPSPRPAAQDRQPVILTTRHPKRFTTAPVTGPKNRIIAMVIELTQAVRIKRRIKYENNDAYDNSKNNENNIDNDNDKNNKNEEVNQLLQVPLLNSTLVPCHPSILVYDVEVKFKFSGKQTAFSRANEGRKHIIYIGVLCLLALWPPWCKKKQPEICDRGLREEMR